MSNKRGLFLKYFVLSPTKNTPYGTASRKAILAYAEAIDRENPQLAHELVSWARHIEAEIKAGTRRRDPRRILEGHWHRLGPRHAFVTGAQWWEWKKTGFAMWLSDKDKAEAEAEKRYPSNNDRDATIRDVLRLAREVADRDPRDPEFADHHLALQAALDRTFPGIAKAMAVQWGSLINGGVEMGCDIHSHAEKQVDGGWVHLGVKAFESRDYGLFGWLANVRNYSAMTPIAAGRGFPADASAETAEHYDDWSLDAHSASWVSVAELLAVDYEQRVEDRRVTKQLGANYWTGAATCEPGAGTTQTLREFLGPDFFAVLKRLQNAEAGRVVFWFDN